MDNRCPMCGGTGDAFDFEKGNWVVPRAPCLSCNGTGERSQLGEPAAAAKVTPEDVAKALVTVYDDGEWETVSVNPQFALSIFIYNGQRFAVTVSELGN